MLLRFANQRSLTTVVLVLSLLILGSRLNAQAEENMAARLTAYKVNGAISDADFRTLLAGLNKGSANAYINNDVMIRYHILVAQSALPAATSKTIDQFAKVLNLNVTVICLPVLDENGKFSIPTGQLIVRFQGAVTDAEAHERLKRFHLSITAQRKRSSGIAYSTIDRDGDIERLLASARELRQDPDVVYADLDKLQLLNSAFH